MLWAFCAGYVLVREFSSSWFSLKSKRHKDINSLKGWFSINQEIRFKDNYKYSVQKINANGKYSKL